MYKITQDAVTEPLQVNSNGFKTNLQLFSANFESTCHCLLCFFRGCKTGEGHFQFLTQQGREILECVKLQTQKLASIRHLPHDRTRRPSLDSVPCTRSSENETVDSLTSNSFS